MRSLRVFFLLAFGIPWVAWGVIAIAQLEPSPLRTALFYAGDFATAGGLVATWVAGGGPALRGLLQRCVRGARARWWLLALLLPLSWQLVARLGYGLFHGTLTTFDPTGVALFLTPAAFRSLTTGPLGEEAGWRGYLLPRLLARYSPLGASLILGLLWDVWHYPLYARSVFASLPSLFSFSVSVVCFAVMMTVLFLRTRGSLLLAVLFHWSVNVAPDVADRMLPVGIEEGGDALRFYELGATVLTALVVALAAGWRTLGARPDFDPVRDLDAEAIAEDSSPAGGSPRD
jgi:membrane protease YdiL (CAAX protease family)